MNTASKIIDECKARVSRTDPPQDCDWPYCDCDPAANWLNPKEAASLRAELKRARDQALADRAFQSENRSLRQRLAEAQMEAARDWNAKVEAEQEAASLRARVAECEAEHPPEQAYLDWCSQGRPDVASLRAELDSLESRLAEAQAERDDYRSHLALCKEARDQRERALESLKERVRAAARVLQAGFDTEDNLSIEEGLVELTVLGRPDILATQPKEER